MRTNIANSLVNKDNLLPSGGGDYSHPWPRWIRQEASFDELAGRHSDDPGDGVYTVTPDALLVPPFRTLAMGMSTGNIDVVRTRFGYHVVERIE